MDRGQFLTQFQIYQPQTAPERYRYPNDVRPASVLIPLIEKEDGLDVLFTIRASHLKHHAGQISFPGGKLEETDANAEAAALRESEEEIGLAAESVSIIGQLPHYQTISGFQITPVVGLISTLPELSIDEGEVSDVFTAPLSHFLNRRNQITIPVQSRMKRYPVHFMPFNGYNIWGATAAMLFDLSNHLTAKSI